MVALVAEGSLKKGVSVNPRGFLCDDFKALNNIAWWYDWGANLDNLRKRSNCVNITENAYHHVPMTWGYGSYFSKYYIYDSAKYLLAFNEPNHHAQSNIQPEDAARYWSKVEELADGRPIVSPAAAPCGSGCNGNTTQWFDTFFQYCNNCRVDYLATHVYKCSAFKTMKFLEDLYKRYNRKIWLTEFACPYTGNPLRELRYMKELLPKLEAADFVFRYAWYVSRVTDEQANSFISTAVNLLERDTSTLTILGNYYNEFIGSSVDHSSTTESKPLSTTSSSGNYDNTTTSETFSTSSAGNYENTTTSKNFSTTYGTVIVSDARRNGNLLENIIFLTVCATYIVLFR